MNSPAEIIEALQVLLTSELSAIHQYMGNAKILGNRGYTKLHDYIVNRAKTEMEHASALMERMIFLQAVPDMNPVLNVAEPAIDVSKIMANDVAAELEAISQYNNAISIAVQFKDNATRALFEDHLQAENEHLFWLEAQIQQINEMGLDNYMSTQV